MSRTAFAIAKERLGSGNDFSDNKVGLFDSCVGDNGQTALIEAENLLLDIADYVYAHTSLKPISKTLFLISRCLCVAKLGGGASNANELSKKYKQIAFKRVVRVVRCSSTGCID
jgi:hypothetical protein